MAINSVGGSVQQTATGGGAPSGAAGGDLGGSYPNPTVVSVADVTTGILAPANGGVPAITVANQGYLLAPTGWATGATASTAVLVSAANQVRAVQMIIPFRTVVTKATWWTQTGAGDTVDFGFYSIDGTTLVGHVGATVSVGAGATQQVTGLSFTINPGLYYFAFTQTGTPTTTFNVITGTALGGGNTNIGSILNVNATKKWVTAGNSATAGALPSSLGTLTTAISPNVPTVVFEP